LLDIDTEYIYLTECKLEKSTSSSFEPFDEVLLEVSRIRPRETFS